MLQQNFRITPIYKEIGEWNEDTGYHMGVFLSTKKKTHEFKLGDNGILNLEKFVKNIQSDCKKNIEKIKKFYDTEKDHENDLPPDIVFFLSESKHKIKKKAEQAACKKAYDILNANI